MVGVAPRQGKHQGKVAGSVRAGASTDGGSRGDAQSTSGAAAAAAAASSLNAQSTSAAAGFATGDCHPAEGGGRRRARPRGPCGREPGRPGRTSEDGRVGAATALVKGNGMGSDFGVWGDKKLQEMASPPPLKGRTLRAAAAGHVRLTQAHDGTGAGKPRSNQPLSVTHNRPEQLFAASGGAQCSTSLWRRILA